MAQDISAPRTTDSRPFPPAAGPAPAADPPPGRRPRPVSLDRLLTVVVLTPAQAALVAVRVLDAGEVPATAPHDGDDDRWSVSVAPSGEVEVTPAGPTSGVTRAAVLDRLVDNARRLPAHPGADQLALLRALQEAAAPPVELPATRARTLERALADALGAGAVPRLTGQLAALVDAFVHVAVSTTASVGAPMDVPIGATGATVSPGPASSVVASGGRDPEASPTPRFTPGRTWRRPGRVSRPRRVALLAGLLAVVAAGSGYVVLRDRDGTTGTPGSDASSASPRATDRSGSAREPRKRPAPRTRTGIEALAPRQAGPVTGVEVQKGGTCAPGAACLVTVTTRFQPAATAQPVTWRVGTARSCRGPVTWSPPVTVTAQPGWTRVYAGSSVAVPRGTLAIVAVTTTPARSQSPPVPVAGPSLQC